MKVEIEEVGSGMFDVFFDGVKVEGIIRMESRYEAHYPPTLTFEIIPDELVYVNRHFSKTYLSSNNNKQAKRL